MEIDEQLTVTLNLAGGVKYMSDGSTRYLVAPVTLIVEGTLNGSQGPILYPSDVVEDTQFNWANVNILLGHPESRSGEDFGIHDPEWLGFIREPGVENGRLTGEAWFHLEKLRREQPELLSRIQAGKKIEVSTGVRVHTKTANGVDQHGRAYDRVATRLGPDHLAVLVGQLGACSIHDGCGINNERNETMCTCDKSIPQDGLLGLPQMDFPPVGNSQLTVRNSAVAANPHDRGQQDLLGLPSYDGFFPNPLTQNKQQSVGRSGVDQSDMLGHMEWRFENPLR